MRNLRDLLLACVICALGLGGFAWAAVSLGTHNAGRIVLTLTPQAVGSSSGREELFISVDTDSASVAICGYSSSALSRTPGTSSGASYAPGGGRVSCKYPDQTLYCLSSGATLSFDEAYIRTATSTATATVTPTP